MEQEIITGLVLSATPIGEYDKRLVILTKEYGKVSAFARGARRPQSSLIAAANPFAFGKFDIYAGKSSYTVTGFHAVEYFRELTGEPEAAYYGFYFLELCDYYSREYSDEREILALLYQSLRALSKDTIPRLLIRRVFELRIMHINGELPSPASMNLSNDLLYTVNYIVTTPIERLYTFKLSEELMRGLGEMSDYYRQKVIDRRMNSLEILETLSDNSMK